MTLAAIDPSNLYLPTPAALVTWSSTAGTWTIAQDGTSGSMDLTLTGGLNGNQTIHATGSWRCK